MDGVYNGDMGQLCCDAIIGGIVVLVFQHQPTMFTPIWNSTIQHSIIHQHISHLAITYVGRSISYNIYNISNNEKVKLSNTIMHKSHNQVIYRLI